ncbi:hypothetical protein [Phreatobacter sp. AB_2022a]|uniref:hypothetical protein n=1 Tax=Phreatobacter sp. AB_2022a TaxID=3003134 RepID=UPI0022871EEA|nr:hypothetical protein [Phreatobacter sp. AB_2022a]MCZ0737820.1 hypothetical protein [Phreatobacter sp. AB_2022a]
MASIVHEPRPARPFIAARSSLADPPRSAALRALARRLALHLAVAGCLALPLIAALALRAYVFVPR